MRWSKVKVLAEDLLCESLKGRVHYQAIVHRKSHDQTGSFRVTFDGVEIFRASDIPYNLAATIRGEELTVERALAPLVMSDWRTMFASEELKHLHAAHDDAEVEVKNRGIFPGWEVKRLLFDYMHMSIEEAMIHEHPFVRAISLFDRRLGKRRLANINPEQESTWVKKFYDIRMMADAGM
ncbi:nonribosomal peptide synthetase [Sporosarcina sp. NPDC096371]|uniref:SF0329 family protein n=1 Tax=Sporosarcina sp. NPDC096371 TaxID=3364530 RepID=UPI0038255D4A